MKSLQRLAVATLMVLATALYSSALINHSLNAESLNYKVMFKWGVINKQAGHATLSLSRGKNSYKSQLTAASEPWADKFFCVRDTLNGRMSFDGFKPLYYEKIANEGTEQKHDVVTYDYSRPGIVHADCSRREIKKGILKVDETKTMQAENAALDMLTSFYYMRTLPFEKMPPGQTQTIAIFSGKQKETLTIKYRGTEQIDVDGVMRNTYHITFMFTSKGGTKSSDDMEAWISTDSSRIPLKLEGKLVVGRVQCFYTGSNL